jgi:hypothetical protein
MASGIKGRGALFHLKKGRSVIKAKNSRRSVYEMVQLLNARGMPINDPMFELIGKHLGIGGMTTVKKSYAT